MDGLKLTGLWKQTDKQGNTYLAGNLNQISRVMIMPNSYKKAEKDPDYFLYLSPNQRRRAAQRKPDHELAWNAAIGGGL